MSLYINSAKENWVVDRFIQEWNAYNYRQDRTYFFHNNLIWLIAPWTWKKIPYRYLSNRKVLCTIHHIDENKFKNAEQEDFYKRDKIVDHYHVISNKTYDQVKKLTDKPITKIPFWVNQNLWKQLKNKNILRKKYQINPESFLIGTFQRDTEGSDLISPKLSKGPDRFVEIAKKLNSKHKSLVVVLTGKRRDYLIKELENASIKYLYFEMVSFEILNDLYNILDLYIVASRYEGGPQAIVECAITKTPIISTDVGLAVEILNKKSIFTMEDYEYAEPDTEYALENVQNLKIPIGFDKFNILIKELNEN
jgi:glycosyltransferase involved in cell wall biosynthesis